MEKSVCFMILDNSGSVDSEKRKVYRELYDKYSKIYDNIYVVSHTTTAKRDTIGNVINYNGDGGTYISSGLNLAIQNMMAVKIFYPNYKMGIVVAGDGDNWSEDNDKLINTIKDCLKNNIIKEQDFEFYEIYPSKYSIPISKKILKALPSLKSCFHTIEREFKKDRTFEIKNKNNETIATYKNEYGEVVSIGKARCNPNDVYNTEEGIRIAVLRALGIDPFGLDVNLLLDADTDVLLNISIMINKELLDRIEK